MNNSSLHIKRLSYIQLTFHDSGCRAEIPRSCVVQPWVHHSSHQPQREATRLSALHVVLVGPPFLFGVQNFHIPILVCFTSFLI